MTHHDHLETIRAHLHLSAEVARATADACALEVSAAAELILKCYQNGGKILLCGNGGSAAQCQHLAAEFVNGLSRNRQRPALAAISLTTDTSLLTAIANDFGFEHVFERQVEALGRPEDVLIAVTTSGNSPNVLLAVERARTLGLATVLLTSQAAGDAVPIADITIRGPGNTTQQIQESHLAMTHCLCLLLEQTATPARLESPTNSR